MTCFVFAKTLWGPGGHSGRPWSQLSGVCVLLHAWAGLGEDPGASCRVYVCCCMPGRASGETL